MSSSTLAPELRWLGAVLAAMLWYARYEFSGMTNVGWVAAAGRREAMAAAAAYGCLPRWSFAVVWFIVYGLNSIGTFLYWRDAAAASRYLAVLAVIGGNVLVNKSWTAVFADARRYSLALAVLLLNLALAIALLVLLGLDAAGHTGWAPFALFLPYALWLVVATVLNSTFVRVYNALPARPNGTPPSAAPRRQ